VYVLFTVLISQVREGYESYGGDCYLDANFRPLKIVRMEHGPTDLSPMEERVYKPGGEGWSYAKFCFRSTLFTLVTVCEHLYGIHLQWSNVMVVAARERLGENHPLRRYTHTHIYLYLYLYKCIYIYIYIYIERESGPT